MRKLLLVLATSVPIVVFPALGHARGCLKGAAVDGIAGHLAHHHAVAGAAIGCVIGHHHAKEKEKTAARERAEHREKEH